MSTARRDRRPLLKPLALLSVAAALLAFLAQAQVAQAATITVTTTADELNADGDCSLREAIQAANTDTAVDACRAGSGADTIRLRARTYTLSIAGAGEDANASGDLDITGDLAIRGARAATTIVQACDSSGGPCTGIDRVLHVGAGTVEISGLTIQNGSADGG
ncbi:MAG TPA: CSLREA domain-containing protein, partial [Dehalococcoidia bacterium]|nr:CSLREA domain-containing protein [Dehalococcoidia bacterium]